MDVFKLVFSLVICLAAGILGSVFTTPNIATWYAALNKPVFNPPNWIFGPVWTTLYILMGIALYIVWNKGFSKNKSAILLFAVQLFLNILWSLLFFGLHSPIYGLVGIVLLWIFILFTTFTFYRTSKLAGLLLIPYILWVSFAAVLNYYIFILN